MRSLVPRLLLTLLVATPGFAQALKERQLTDVEENAITTTSLPVPDPTPVGQTTASAPTADAGAAAGATNSEAISNEPTVFNGVSVPPMKELQPGTFAEDTKEGYWFVKHYSPYCVHCKTFAPAWQTLYEFYYTSQPVTGSSKKNTDSSTSLNSFHGYYNFHFASIDCFRWADFCQSDSHNVAAWPTMILYKDGKEAKRYSGAKTVADLSAFIEEALDSIKPGSRPKPGALVLPAAGDHSVEPTPAGTASTPNPQGTSIPLNQESFQKLVTTSQEPWLIEFYAPWCHHCQKLAPNWHQMSREMQGKLNVGQVNCDEERRLCKDVHVKGYPTIHFFRGGERVEYIGLRGLGDLVSYAKKGVDIGMGVTYVDAASFKKLEQTEEVIFVYFYDHATTAEDFAALDRLTLSLIGHAKLVKTDSDVLADRFKIHTWPKLLVSRDGRPSYYNAPAPKDMRDFRRVLNWMQRVWLPLVPELTASNSHDVMDGHLVVLGVLSRDSDEFPLNKKEMKNAAIEWMDRETHAFQLERQELRDSKQLRIEEAEDRDDQRALRDAKLVQIQISEENRRQVRFAWVDGVFWQRWIRTTYGIEIKDGVRVVITDEDNKRYWDTTITHEPIRPSRTSILETLKKITHDPPQIGAKYTTNKVAMVYLQLKRLGFAHPWASTVLFLAGLLVVAAWGRRRIRRSRGSQAGFFVLGDRDPGLGGGAGGKSD